MLYASPWRENEGVSLVNACGKLAVHMPLKHTMPPFLANAVSPESYERWLSRKATAHAKRDKMRGQSGVTRSLYKEAIHAAVLACQGRDTYTGEDLNWKLISTYNNERSKAGRHGYKASFALLPTVDHVAAGATEASFRICSWRTNDAKHDLSVDSFLDLCKMVLTHAGYSIARE